MPTLKLAHGVRLADQPIETKVALRLVTLAEQHKNTAELRVIAKEIGAVFMDVLKAVELLAARKVITFKAITANQFHFEVEAENRKALLRDASTFERHLKAKAIRARRVRTNPPPAHLVPFTESQRAPHMARAAEIATKIGAPRLAYKIANCILRIGQKEVDALLDCVIKTPRPPEVSGVRAFFTLYSVRRDLLVPPPVKQPVAVATNT